MHEKSWNYFRVAVICKAMPGNKGDPIDGFLIAQLRGDRGWSQAELAMKSRVSKKTIERIEVRNPVNVTRLNIGAFAEAFGVKEAVIRMVGKERAARMAGICSWFAGVEPDERDIVLENLENEVVRDLARIFSAEAKRRSDRLSPKTGKTVILDEPTD